MTSKICSVQCSHRSNLAIVASVVFNNLFCSEPARATLAMLTFNAFSAWTLLFGCQEGHPACKIFCSSNLMRFPLGHILGSGLTWGKSWKTGLVKKIVEPRPIRVHSKGQKKQNKATCKEKKANSPRNLECCSVNKAWESDKFCH